MKKTIILPSLLIVIGLMLSSFAMDRDTGPAFAWKTIQFDFGEIQQGEPVFHKFTFTNDGDDVLYITKIKTSCGCTAAEYSTDGIAPGEEGFVKVRYNASKTGAFKKTVTIEANTGNIPILTVMGNVQNLN